MSKEDYINSINEEGEDWRFIPDTSEDYAISSYGRVLSFKARSPKLLSIVVQESRGRKYSYVCINSIKTRVHRLVAESFLPNPESYNEIDHINNNPIDNRACNLRWCSHRENMRNPYTRQSEREYKLANPTKVNTSVFYNRHEDTMKPIVQIKDDVVIATFSSIGETEKHGYKKASVSAAINGRLKTYRGCKWMLLSEYKKAVRH